MQFGDQSLNKIIGNGTDIDIADDDEQQHSKRNTNSNQNKQISYKDNQKEDFSQRYNNPDLNQNFRILKNKTINKFTGDYNGDLYRKQQTPHSHSDHQYVENHLKQINNFPEHEAGRLHHNYKKPTYKNIQNNIKSFRKNNNGFFHGKGIQSNHNQVTPTRADSTAHMMHYTKNNYKYSSNTVTKEFRFKELDQNPNSQIDDPIFNKMHNYKNIDFINESLIQINRIQDTLDKGLDMKYQLKNKKKVDKARRRFALMSTMNQSILDHWQKVSGPLNIPRPVPGQAAQVLSQEDKEDLEREKDEMRFVDQDKDKKDKKDDKKKEDKKELDPELKKYKKFVDQDQETVKDFRSDYDLHKDTYYDPNGTKITEYPHQKFFKKIGDNTTITQIKKAVNSSGPIAIAKKQMKLWEGKVTDLNLNLKKDLMNLNERRDLLGPELLLLTEQETAAEMTMKLANWEVNFLKTLMGLFDDAALSMFQQVSIAQVMDMPNNNEEALPAYFHVLNLVKSSDIAELSEFKVVEPDKIQLKSDPVVNDDSGQGVLLTTKQHKTQDGSLHFTVKMPDVEGQNTFGVFFRYSDQFTNYALKFDFKAKEVSLIRNSPWAFLMVNKQVVKYLAKEQYLRVVIKFSQNRIKWWIHPEEGSKETKLDDSERNAEFAQQSDMYIPFKDSDAGMKEGRIGFFCANCKGLVLKNITFYADTCLVEDKSGGPFSRLQSPLSARYTEDFKKSTSTKYTFWHCENCFPSSEWVFKEVNGKLRGLTNTGKMFNAVEKKAPATLLQLKNKSFWHYNSLKVLFSLKMGDGKSGSAFLLFKLKNAMNQLGMGINFSKAKGTKKVYVFQMKGGKYIELYLGDFPGPFNPAKWNKFQLTILDNVLTVIMNSKDIIVDMLSNDEFMDPEGGTIGFGSNNVITEFSEIKMDIVLPDAFMLFLETLRRSSKMTQMKFTADEELETALENEAAGAEEEPVTQEELVSYLECLAPATLAERKDACVKVLSLEANDECGLGWCVRCCTPKGALKSKCVEECDANYVMNEPPEDMFDRCLNPPSDFSESEKSNDCQQCCKDLRSKAPEIVQDRAIQACKDKFSKCNDEFGSCYQSLSIEAEEE